MRICFILPFLMAVAAGIPLSAADGNRLTYLDNLDPYYVSRSFPRLTTPQWVGEEGVDAVVIMAVDDMRDAPTYEKFLRPILDRMEQIDGKAHLSIMTCRIDPKEPHLQKWLEEGVSLETHTVDHPCPLLQGGDFAKAKSTFDRCVDQLSEAPNSHPVAFRMPCCDSKNTPSPRAWAEIFNQTTPHGNFVRIDTSVFDLYTPNDPTYPRDLVIDSDGRGRFAKYLPFESFANAIQDYPYPYVIGKLCWEFPCVAPSDWESFNIQGKVSPRLLEDWKAALDATVLKQGTMTLVFHPWGWSSARQHVEFINYAQSKYGKRVKFLSFRDALQRLEMNALGGQPLRAANGKDNGVRLLDLNNDGYMDAVIGNDNVRQTRVWSPQKHQWIVSDFPTPIVNADNSDAGVRFGIFQQDGFPSMLVKNQTANAAWRFDGGNWVSDQTLLAGLELNGPLLTSDRGRDRGLRFHDLDNDGICELIVANESQQAVFSWDPMQRRWTKLPFALPAGASVVDSQGRDAGLRLIDIDGDGYDDVLFSNDDHYSLSLFTSMRDGWSRQVRAGKRGDKDEIPALVRNGTNNGGWFLNRTLWVQNEQTAALPDGVDRRTFAQLLEGVFATAHSPEASLHNLQLRPGFQAELAASEPLVQSPIAIAWGPDGRCWVVEMSDYPLGVDGKGKPGGRVKILQDTDGDGKYVKSTVFLDNLPFPTGVMPWGKGVLIADAPNILYAEDTKRDGHADVVKILFTGFVEGNQQHRLNGLQYGLDNWVYGANGHSGGHVKSMKTGQVVDISGRDFRIKPDEGIIETTTGVTQYGHCMDDWGNWFGCDNSNPDFQFVLDDHYLRRNPHFAPPPPSHDVPDMPGAAPVYPISPDLPRFNDFWALHHFTSANSVIIYRDDLFGPVFYGNSFVSEPVGNLVHREIMRRDGILFHSSRASDEQKSEFLASFDGWCRPTMLRVGPDGALWVVDMYRLVIEHPEWIPKEWQQKLDLRAGHDKGRIYRIYPVGVSPRRIPRLDALDAAGFVAALDSPSGWQRDMAQQLLVQRHDLTAVPLLEKAAIENARDLCRLHALCALEGLGALKPEVLEKALSDSQPGVRRQAVRMYEALFTKAPQLGQRVMKLAADPDPQVRMQVAYSLGEWDDARAGQALGHLAVDNRGAPYIEAAAMTSLSRGNLEPVLSALLSSAQGTPPPVGVLSNLLRFAQAVGDRNVIASVLLTVCEPRDGKFAPWQFAAAGTLLDALDANRTSLRSLAVDGNEQIKSAVQKLSAVFGAARAVASDGTAPDAIRAAAIGLLGRDDQHRQEDLGALGSLLAPQIPADLQSAAISALGRLPGDSAPPVLLRGWRTYSPVLRVQVLDAILNRPELASALVDAIEHKRVLAADLDAIRRQRLLSMKNASLRDRAAKMFAGVVKPDRQKIVEAYQPALELHGDAARGAQVFARICTQCHHFGGVGNAVGPDLASIGDKSPPTLLVSILDPNRAVEPKYVAYVLETKDGRTLSGVLGTETATSITLLQANVPPVQVLRTDIAVLRSTGISLMPEGLESGLSQQDLADLISHIRSSGPAPRRKEFAGNTPQVIRPDASGKLMLSASLCEIYGSTITFEPKYGNLGYWHTDDDSAAWTVHPEKPGKYELWMNYSCQDSTGGNMWVVQCGASRLAGKIEGTGGWDDYRRVRLGEIDLTAGQQRVTFRSLGNLNGDLCDLRGLELIPARTK